MALEDVLREMSLKIKDLEDRILELESEHGEVAGFHFGNSFPTDPYANQIVVRTDQVPPAGGTIYRWDAASSNWIRVN